MFLCSLRGDNFKIQLWQTLCCVGFSFRIKLLFFLKLNCWICMNLMNLNKWNIYHRIHLVRAFVGRLFVSIFSCTHNIHLIIKILYHAITYYLKNIVKIVFIIRAKVALNEFVLLWWEHNVNSPYSSLGLSIFENLELLDIGRYPRRYPFRNWVVICSNNYIEKYTTNEAVDRVWNLSIVHWRNT